MPATMPAIWTDVIVGDVGDAETQLKAVEQFGYGKQIMLDRDGARITNDSLFNQLSNCFALTGQGGN